MVKWKLLDDEGYDMLVCGVDDADGDLVLSDGTAQIHIEELPSLRLLLKHIKKAIKLKEVYNNDSIAH